MPNMLIKSHMLTPSHNPNIIMDLEDPKLSPTLQESYDQIFEEII